MESETFTNKLEERVKECLLTSYPNLYKYREVQLIYFKELLSKFIELSFLSGRIEYPKITDIQKENLSTIYDQINNLKIIIDAMDRGNKAEELQTRINRINMKLIVMKN